MANINVLMVVDTLHISSNNLDTTVFLIDDNGDSEETSGDPTTFDINAKDGDTVTFNIAAIDGSTRISFVKFEHENGSEIFDPMPKVGNLWIGTVSGSVGDSENFSIKFNVEGKGKFVLDPELKVKN
ncbi:MAG: hypothetical protein NXI20_28720 [bacterium]|nr:hypothetical protein [bacterium]